jgi:uncharacterized delta-60 repeat protein
MSWDSVGIRITPAGVVDASRTFALGLSGWNDTFTRVVALPDGSVRFIGGAQVTAGGDYDTTIAGVTPTFAIDTAFGTGATGKLRIDLGGNDAAYGVARQVDGQLLVSGFANGDAVVARVAVNGAGLDGSFGAAGRRSVDLGSGDDSGSRMVLEEDGRILVTGSTSWGFSGGTPGSDLALFRLTTSGALDTTFDQDGIRLFDVGGDRDMGFGIAPVVDGTIMVAGVSTVAGVERFTSIRMSGATVENWLDGSRDWDQGASAFGACLKATALASPVWTIDATCAPVDGSQWNDIPASQDVIATTASGQSAATATMRFGLRAAMSQRPGSYIAPVTFTVLAPG